MARVIELRPIGDIIADIRKETDEEIERSAKYARERAEDRIRAVELNRQAFALLDAAGFDLSLDSYLKGTSYTLALGYFPQTKAGNAALVETLRRVRVTLGCRLENEGKDIGDCKKRHITYTLKPVEFPNINVTFQRRLSRGAKCKIVTQRSTYKSLVCSV